MNPVENLIGNSSLKWSTIPALNGQPFQAGIFIYHVGWVLGGMVVTTMTSHHVWNHFRADLTLSRVENTLKILFSTGLIFIYHVGWVDGGLVVTMMTNYHFWNHFRVDLTLSRVENTLKI